MSNDMNLIVPTVGVTSGPTYAQDISADLTTISGHTHTGSANSDGAQLDTDALDLTHDLSLNDNNLSNTRSVELVDNAGVLVGSGDINCIYDVSGDLWWNDALGQPVQITSGNTININNIQTQSFSLQSVVDVDWSILNTDTYNFLQVSLGSAAHSITLPVANTVVAGRFYYIQDTYGTADVHNITIQVAGASGDFLNVFNGLAVVNASYVINEKLQTIIIWTDGIGSWWVLPFDRHSYKNEQLNLLGSSTLQVKNSSNIELSGSAQLLMDSGTEIHIEIGASVLADAGSEITINGKLDGSVTSGALTLGGTSQIKVSNNNAVLATVANAITTNIANGINDGGIAAGIQASVAGGIQSSTAGGIVLAGGSSDYPTFGSTRSFRRRFPLITNISIADTGGTQYGPWELVNTDVDGDLTFYTPNASSHLGNTVAQVFFIPQVWNGATVTSIAAKFIVSTLPSSISAMAVPTISVYRVSLDNGSGLPSSSKEYLGSTHTQGLAAPATTAAYYNSGNVQSLSYTCDQNNVIDDTTYLYYMAITDASGTVTGSADYWYGYEINYTVSDMRPM